MSLKIFKVLAAVCIIATTVFAQAAINETNFPCPIFREAIEAKGINSGNIATTTSLEFIGGTHSSADGRITGLKGIEHFTALEELVLIRQNLTEIDISKNTALRVLNITQSGLTKLDISRNTALEKLSATNNFLTELDMSNNTALEYVFLGNNQLRRIAIIPNHYYDELWLDGNQLPDFDFSVSGNISRLNLSNNFIPQSKLPDNHSSFWTLQPQTDLPAGSIFINAETFPDFYFRDWVGEHLNNWRDYLTPSEIQNVVSIVVPSLNISNLKGIEIFTNLSNLNIENNNITSLDVSGLTNLSTLAVSGNRLLSLDLSGLNGAVSFTGGNQEVSLTLSGCGNNFGVNVSLNTPTNLANGITYANGTLTSTNKAVNSSPFSVETGRAGAHLTGTLSLTYEEIVHNWGEWALRTPATCSAEGVEARTCGGCGTEETRSVAVNSSAHNWSEWTTAVPAACGVEGRQARSCSICEEAESRSIAALIDGCPIDITDKFIDPIFRARILAITGKTPSERIFNTDVDTITALNIPIRRSRTRSENNEPELIRDLSGIEHLVALRFIDLEGHDVNTLNLRNNPDVEHINLRDNQLVQINISNNLELIYLDVSGNRLTEINLTNNLNLEHLDVSYNQLVRLDITDIPLRFLDVSENHFESRSDIVGIRAELFDEENFIFGAQREFVPNHCISFDELIVKRFFGTTMIITNNREELRRAFGRAWNFVEFEWYRDGKLIGTEQSLYAHDGIPAGTYKVRAKTENNNWIESCEKVISVAADNSRSAEKRPELISRGGRFYVEANIDESLLSGAEIVIYNTAGSVIARIRVDGQTTEIAPRLAAAGHLFVLVDRNGTNRILRKVAVE